MGCLVEPSLQPLHPSFLCFRLLVNRKTKKLTGDRSLPRFLSCEDALSLVVRPTELCLLSASQELSIWQS